jgi:hypothetical protein
MISLAASRFVRVDMIGMDDLRRDLGETPALIDRARNSALASIGYTLKRYLRSTVNSNPAGWPALAQITRRIKTNPPTRGAKGRNPPARSRGFWGSLASLPVYTVDKSAGVMVFGFQEGTFGTRRGRTRSDGTKTRTRNVIGASVVELARVLTEGGPRLGINRVGGDDASQRMRRYFAAMGVPLQHGHQIRLKPRPLIGPHYERFRARVPEMFREKFWASMQRYTR